MPRLDALLARTAVLQRAVWLGLVPATLAVLTGAGLRRWMPKHLMACILGRGFFITAVAGSLAGVASVLLHGQPPGLSTGDLMLARAFSAWGDAFITGLLVAIVVAVKPQWLATCADRLHLPR